MVRQLRDRTDDELDRRSEDLADFRDCLDEAGLTYWLASGALLGAVRDGDFIPWDWDVEIDVKTEEAVAKAPTLADLLAKAGFKVKPRIQHGSFRIMARRRRDGILGDRIEAVGFDLLPDGNGGQHRRRIRFNCPSDVWDTGFYVELRGERYQAHAPVEKYLSYTYGPDWRTPKRTVDKKVYLSEQFRGAQFR